MTQQELEIPEERQPDDGWNYLDHPNRVGRYVRWRHDGDEHVYYGAGYEVQTYRAGEWRTVRSWNSRDWFALGLMASNESEE